MDARSPEQNRTRVQLWWQRELQKIMPVLRAVPAKRPGAMSTIFFEDASLAPDAVVFFTQAIKELVKLWQETPEPHHAQYHLDAARYAFDELRIFAAFHKLDVEEMLAADLELALACSVIALNPGG